ncbi:MAG: GGDEF domain-containing protein [Ferrimicrobium sp.]
MERSEPSTPEFLRTTPDLPLRRWYWNVRTSRSFRPAILTQRLHSRLSATLFGIGGLVGLLVTLSGGAHGTRLDIDYGFIAFALLASILQLRFGSTIPNWSKPVILTIGNVAIIAFALLSASAIAKTPVIAYMTLTEISTFLYYSWTLALAEVALTVTGVVLISEVPPAPGLAIGITFVITTLSVGLLVAWLIVLAATADIDSLTGAKSKAALMREGERIAARARLKGTPLGAIFFDFDHFKEINNSLGHLGADHLLRTTVQDIADVLRPEDIIARFGGDEFVILCPGATQTSLESITTRIESIAKAKSPVTTGAALTQGSETLSELLLRADKRLYEGKNAR